MLKRCTVCELRCGVDRTHNEPCPCGAGAETYGYKRYVSLNEGAALSPALRVFWGGCNFRCRFCDEGPDSFRRAYGERVEPERLAVELMGYVDQGVRSISLIGGEPTLHPHTILALAACASRRLPLVVNSNMYMTTEVLDLLDGVVSTYLADFKFGNDACARHLAHVPRYWEVVTRNIAQAARSTEVVVRHLLLPGHFDCCFRRVVDWMAAHRPTVPFQLYTGYVPCWRASSDPSISRLNSRTEIKRATEYMSASSLVNTRVMNERELDLSPVRQGGSALTSITVGVDGRVYCHDLTPELATVVQVLSPSERDSTGESFCGSTAAGGVR